MPQTRSSSASTAMQTADARDFQRIARAVALLAEHWRDQPSLAWVADEVGLSEFHLQRLFSRWVGISPKRFVQYITRSAARQYLADASLLDAALACGLSGSARLHDLFIRYEGMSPGEFKQAVAGHVMTWGELATPFGRALAVFAPRGLHRLEFVADDRERDAMLARLQTAYPMARWQPATTEQLGLVARGFQMPGATDPDASPTKNGSTGSPLTLCVTGSAFQLKVWEALLSIPPGQSVSYGGLAARLQQPGAARAVGNALAANAVAVLIPCHRVIRETGVIGHFRWGSERKLAMLGWERARADVAGPMA